MQAEQIEVLDFLRNHPPFKQLSEEELNRLATNIEISYFKAGTPILEFGQQLDAWYIIRSGSVEIYRRNGELYNRLSEGGYFGEFGLLRNKSVRFPVTAIEDTLTYLIPDSEFQHLFDNNELFADMVEVEDRSRLRHAIARKEDSNELMTARVDTLITREPVMLPDTVNVREAAICMTEQGVSSLLIINPNAPVNASAHGDDEAYMVGVITDRDLRTRLISEGLDYDTPIRQIMSTDLISIDRTHLVFEAMLLMLRFNVHHLPVLRGNRPIGVVAMSDMLRYETQNSLFLVGSIFRQTQVEDLAALRNDVLACFVRMVNEDANSRMIGGAMALIGRSFKQRLLELAEEKLGPPPVPYCFLALGSMARQEQLVVTDQDNALILSDRYDETEHGAYFEALAQFVCDGLNACGYSYCKGGIMATNPRWRQPLRVWKSYFIEWIDHPTPESLLNSSIFFDLDGVWGETEWVQSLYRMIVNRSRRSPRFLACMARNALLRRPPLGFFRDFVMEKDGRHTNSINMKRRGTAPIADLIRVHALAIGSTAINTFKRLEDIIEAEILPRGRGQDLRDALELIAMVRIRHQALDIVSDTEPDNNIEPENLSEFERKNLKDAFQILSNAQRFLRYRYQPGRSN